MGAAGTSENFLRSSGARRGFERSGVGLGEVGPLGARASGFGRGVGQRAAPRFGWGGSCLQLC